MGTKIHIPADEVWSFFQKNKDRLSEEMVVIAENTDTEYAVYLTEEDDYPLFAVCKGGSDSEYEEGAISQQDCTDTAKQCYRRYLFPVVVTSEKTSDEPWEEDDVDTITAQMMEDAVYEREDELMLAMGDFLQVVLQEGSDGSEVIDTYGMDFINELLDHILSYIASDCGLPVYRPTFLTDELGNEDYVEYPYNEEEEDLADSLSRGSDEDFE